MLFLLNSIVMRLTTFKKRHSRVAKDKSFGTAGTRPPQRSQLPSSFSPSWASEPLWDSDRWEASPHWPFLNSATSPQVSVIIFLRGEAHGDTDLLGQEQKVRNYLREGVWMRDECEALPWRTATHGNIFPWTHFETWACCYRLTRVPRKFTCWSPSS